MIKRKVIKKGLTFSLKTNGSWISIDEIQKQAKEEFGSTYHPDSIKIKIEGSSLVIDNTNAYHPASKKALNQLLRFNLSTRKKKK